MNLLLFRTEDRQHDEVHVTNPAQLAHMHTHLQCQVGDLLKVGELGGNRGVAQLVRLDQQEAVLALQSLHTPPLPKLPLTVLLALPRPKAIKRLLQDLTTLGCSEIILCNAARVEKSYWQTPFLQPDSVHEHLLTGLQQAGDTILPTVTLAKRLRPYVEDVLAPRIATTPELAALMAHPYATAPLKTVDDPTHPVMLAIGPEGGWVPFELDLLGQAGFQPVSLGQRILRTETAISVAAGRLFAH